MKTNETLELCGRSFGRWEILKECEYDGRGGRRLYCFGRNEKNRVISISNYLKQRKNIMRIQKAIAITTALLFGFCNAPAQQAPAGNKLESKWSALAGEWSGEGTGNPGSGSGTSSFQFDLQKQV